jgi:neutral amino acid transport system permease protein
MSDAPDAGGGNGDAEDGAEKGSGGQKSAFERRDDEGRPLGEQIAYYTIGAVAALLVVGVLTGLVSPAYLLSLLSLAAMYGLLSLGLNVQWGYTGLINFSVAAFFGIGAYVPVLLAANDSPLSVGLPPILGLFVAVVAVVLLALAIGIPTLSLREDYLAIASLGLAEVVRLIFRNESQWTKGTSGILSIPSFFEGVPFMETFAQSMPTVQAGIYTLSAPFWANLLNFLLASSFVLAAYVVLRRVHRSPWGRVLRTIRSDEDLAEALGKNTFAFRMQAFVLGSLVMMLAGVFYAFSQGVLLPDIYDPIFTFYAWIAVILGGSGSNRGALFGGVVLVAIIEGTRTFGVGASTRLLLVGALIILVMRFRPQGVLPPREELIWPGARGGRDD